MMMGLFDGFPTTTPIESAAPTATPTATPTARPPRHATSADDIDGTSGPIIVNYLPIQTIQRLRHQDLMSLGKSMGVGNIMRMNTKRKATRAVEMHLFNAFDHEHWVNIKIVLDFTNPLCNKPIIFCISLPPTIARPPSGAWCSL